MPARKIYRILVMVFLCSAPGACMKDVDFDQVNDLTLTPEVETGLVYVDTLTTCDMLDGLATEKTLCSLIPDETIGMAELHTLLELLGGENLNGPAGRINVVDEEVGFNLFSEPYVIDHLEEASLVFEVGSTLDVGGRLILMMRDENGNDLGEGVDIELKPLSAGEEYIGRDTLEYSSETIEQLKKTNRMYIRIDLDGSGEIDKNAYLRLKSMGVFGLNIKK
ncbi:hypothetical protein [Sinomicrobium soli]|uniref:hypothetical protein n=1 Tax=Sinomicrobium sp. N-1-3-6 TaxID=2219864 RepID=UPI000DCD500F|nr:hypothetical protein [Sinomicrobium sp. N-1-3-6]RAV29813.1 hypothetical protein DN748_06795 [Sinomicrobium sp. N-1-3-6]